MELSMVAPSEKWDRWDTLWGAVKDQFWERILYRDSILAWEIWSRIVEETAMAEGVGTGRRRHVFRSPRWEQAQAKGACKLGFRTRRVGKVARQLKGARAHGGDAVARIKRRAKDVRGWHPELEQFDWADPAMAQRLGALHEYLRIRDEEQRLGDTKMDNCERELIDWINKDEDVEGTGLDGPTSSQEGRVRLGRIWRICSAPWDTLQMIRRSRRGRTRRSGTLGVSSLGTGWAR